MYKVFIINIHILLNTIFGRIMRMQWNSKDLTQYLDTKEYIDTIIIPLQAFHMSQDNQLKKDAFLRNVLSIYTKETEKELSGRVLLTPAYNYLKFTELEEEVIRLNEWVENIKKQPFKTIFFMTFDMKWKKVESKMDGHLIWLPGIDSVDLQAKETAKMIQNQVTQIGELIRSYW